MMQFETNNDLKSLPIVSVHLDVDYCLMSDIEIKTARDAIEFVADKIYDSAKENAIAIFYDCALNPLCVATVGSGTQTNVTFSARDIVQTALLCNASFVTIMHNHPGLNAGKKKCEPSKDDVLVTDTIIKACSLVGVQVYDSIITTAFKKSVFGIPEPVYYSMREKGYRKFKRKYGIKNDKLPTGENDLNWEYKEEQTASNGINYRFVDKQTKKIVEYSKE